MSQGIDAFAELIGMVLVDDPVKFGSIQQMKQLAEEANIYLGHGMEFAIVPKLGKCPHDYFSKNLFWTLLNPSIEYLIIQNKLFGLESQIDFLKNTIKALLHEKSFNSNYFHK